MENMGTVSKDDGVITVLLMRLNEQRLPRLFALQHKVKRGDSLNDYDIAFLNQVCYEVRRCHEICKTHHEYDDLFCKVCHFFREITKTAVDNERKLH